MENPILKLIDAIAARPAMYVGAPLLYDVACTLDGYELALMERGLAPDEFGHSFQRWVEYRFGIVSADWNWPRILHHCYQTEEAAIRALPQLYREYLRDAATMTPWEVELRRHDQCLALYGQESYVPAETHTHSRLSPSEMSEGERLSQTPSLIGAPWGLQLAGFPEDHNAIEIRLLSSDASGTLTLAASVRCVDPRICWRAHHTGENGTAFDHTDVACFLDQLKALRSTGQGAPTFRSSAPDSDFFLQLRVGNTPEILVARASLTQRPLNGQASNCTIAVDVQCDDYDLLSLIERFEALLQS